VRRRHLKLRPLASSSNAPSPARPGFALGPDNVADIIDIVRHLDGLPLALELAAARIRAMSPAALAERLNKGFDLLSGAQESMIPRASHTARSGGMVSRPSGSG